MSIGTSYHVRGELCIDAGSVSCIESDVLTGTIIIAFLIAASPKLMDYYPSTSPKLTCRVLVASTTRHRRLELAIEIVFLSYFMTEIFLDRISENVSSAFDVKVWL